MGLDARDGLSACLSIRNGHCDSFPEVLGCISTYEPLGCRCSGFGIDMRADGL